METIKTYLDNMFLPLPKSREVLSAKEELLNMMEDKYLELKASGKTENESVGIVITEFGNLDEIAEELGLSIHLKNTDRIHEKDILHVDAVKDFILARMNGSFKVAIGVALAIWSPILLILLSTTDHQNVLGFQNGGLALGILVLVVLVAAAVALFVMSSTDYGKYDLDKQERFTLHPQAEAYVRAEESRNRVPLGILITIGVVLCIVSLVPLLLFSLLEVSDKLLFLSVGFLIFIVGTAVFLFVVAGSRKASYDILLKKGEYSPESRIRTKKAETIGSIYWPLIVLIYLYWSFTTGDWYLTWIVWPLAGLLFAAIVGISSLYGEKR